MPIIHTTHTHTHTESATCKQTCTRVYFTRTGIRMWWISELICTRGLLSSTASAGRRRETHATVQPRPNICGAMRVCDFSRVLVWNLCVRRRDGFVEGLPCAPFAKQTEKRARELVHMCIVSTLCVPRQRHNKKPTIGGDGKHARDSPSRANM